MRIDSSTVLMSSSRSYTAEATETNATIIRCYSGGQLANTNVRTSTTEISQFEAEGGMSVYTTSADGVVRDDKYQTDYANTEENPVEDKSSRQNAGVSFAPLLQNNHWISTFMQGVSRTSETELLKKMLELLELFTGKKSSGSLSRLSSQPSSRGISFGVSASSVSARYQETMAMLNIQGSSSSGSSSGGQSSGANGHWTRQTVQSGFVSGQEHTAFCSKGTVVTSDGRTIDFNVTMEMSHSFEAAYTFIGKEEVYTDPLIINMDADTVSISDVSFYFDLDCDGVEEELSSLDAASGFLALDKNGDGEINDGSELFGAKTGDGFGELAQYDQDGNGWIDENDDIFSSLSVWTKCGTGEAQLLSLSEADVGAIFLGSQSTQHSLTDSSGTAGAILRKTGIYLKESGQVGTIQHVDFKM